MAVVVARTLRAVAILAALAAPGCTTASPFECNRTPDLIRAWTGPQPRYARFGYVVDCGVEYREAWRALYLPLRGGRP